MEKVTRNYLIATLIVLAIAMVEYFTRPVDLVFIILPIVLTVLLYPLMVLGLYMFTESKGYRYVNGIDWNSMADSQRDTLVSYAGLSIAIGMILVAYGMLCLYSNNPVGGIFLFALGIIIMILPVPFKNKMMNKRHIKLGTKSKIAAFAVFSILMVVPLMTIGLDDASSTAVSVEYGDASVTIKAPMVNETFEYTKITGLEYDKNFDKGVRVSGYGTSTVCSGTFNNSAFGNYTLASYTQVNPCVFFQYEGKYFAFNQNGDDKTLEAFEILKNKIQSS